MKLGYFVPEFPGQTHIFFWREIKALRSLGVDVHLLSSRKPAPGACKHEFAAEAAAATHYVFPPRWGDAVVTLNFPPTRMFKPLRYLQGLKETPLKRRFLLTALLASAADLFQYSKKHGVTHIHGHSCADVAHLLALTYLLGGPTYSLTLHGDLPVYGVDHKSKMALARFVACVTTPLQKQVIEQAGVPPEKAPVIWMGVETERFQDQGRRTFESGKLHLVTVARLQANKGHRFALAALKEAVAQGCDVRYTIAGEGPDRAAIEAVVSELGLGDRVKFTGTLAEGAVLELLQTADAFCLPSVGLGEAAPVSVMEAMACGLPVLCSIIGGTPDMIQDQVNGLLLPQGDVPALTAAMVKLARDLDERKRIGLAARQRAVQAFDARETARKLLDTIRATTGA
jgi:glycosyltransferase involved in cell wall biosynthesis